MISSNGMESSSSVNSSDSTIRPRNRIRLATPTHRSSQAGRAWLSEFQAFCQRNETERFPLKANVYSSVIESYYETHGKPDHWLSRNARRFLIKLANSIHDNIQNLLVPWDFDVILSNEAHHFLKPLKTTVLGDQYGQLCHSSACNHDNLAFKQKSSVTEFKETPDCILAAPLTGLASHTNDNVTTKGNQKLAIDRALSFIIDHCSHLHRHGTALFVVPNGLLEDCRARDLLKDQGLHPSVVVDLPPEELPQTDDHYQVVVLVPHSVNEILVGKWANDSNHEDRLLQRIQNRRASECTRVVLHSAYKNFTRIDTDEQLQRRARRMGLTPHNASSVFEKIRYHKDYRDVSEEPFNALYIPENISAAATSAKGDLNSDVGSFYCVTIDPDHAKADYLALLLNTSFGLLWRKSIEGNRCNQIDKNLLQSSSVYLPPDDTSGCQENTIQAINDLNRFKNEIAELEQELWRNPLQPRNISKAVRSITIDDDASHLRWVDSLPFPLASILWKTHAESRIEIIVSNYLHFFEALAQFLGTIHLSAFKSDVALWNELNPKLQTILEEQNLSFKSPTFGIWKITCQVLSAKARQLINGNSDSQNHAGHLYGTRNFDVVGMLASAELIDILDIANSYRNKKAHGGYQTDRERKELLMQLEGLTSRTRSVMKQTWLDYQLLKPTHLRCISHNHFESHCKSIVGSRTPFAIKSVETDTPMKDGHLYLTDPADRLSLQLLPFIQVRAAPTSEENACYFYNGETDGLIHLVSYHNQADPELSERDTDLADHLDDVLDGLI